MMTTALSNNSQHESRNLFKMKFLNLALLLMISTWMWGQVDTSYTGNRVHYDLDLGALMDTLQSIRSDLSTAESTLNTLENSQTVSAIYATSTNQPGGVAYYINGHLLFYATLEDMSGTPVGNYTLTVKGENLKSDMDVDLFIRGVDITGEGMNLTDAPNNWFADADGETASFDLGYTQIKDILNQEDGFLQASLMIDGYNSGQPIMIYLDSENEAPDLSTFSTSD